MITLTHNGKDYKVVGYNQLKDGDHFVSVFGTILLVEEGVGSSGGERLIVEPVPVEHIFGGVVYVEGETRRSTFKDYWLSPIGGYLVYGYAGSGKRVILHPVRIVDTPE